MNKTKEQNIVLSAKLGLLALGTVAITLAIIILFVINLKWQTTNNNDISGWCSLIVGSAIGIYITFAILIYSDYSQQKISKLIETTSQVISDQQQKDDRRKQFSLNTTNANLKMIDHHIMTVDNIVNNIANDQREKSVITEEIKYNLNEKNYYMNLIEMTANLHSDVLDPVLLFKIFDVCRIVKMYELFEKDGTPFNFPNITSAHTEITKLRNDLK